MKSVRLGKTGLQVSRIGLGGIPIQRPTEPEAIREMLVENLGFYEEALRAEGLG